jgi:hypothetical protein
MGRVFLIQFIQSSTCDCARFSAQLGQHQQGQNRFQPVALPPRFPRVTQFTKMSRQAPQIKDLPSFCVTLYFDLLQSLLRFVTKSIPEEGLFSTPHLTLSKP